MKHLGDITKIHGDEIEPVDIITGGSPCQDLSVAGKRNGERMRKRNASSERTGHEPEQQQRGEGILVLNDQGGGVMSVSYEVTGTIRAQMGGHPPLVLVGTGNGNGWGGSISPTITGDHQNRITDYTVLVVQSEITNDNAKHIPSGDG